MKELGFFNLEDQPVGTGRLLRSKPEDMELYSYWRSKLHDDHEKGLKDESTLAAKTETLKKYAYKKADPGDGPDQVYREAGLGGRELSR